MHSVTCHTNGCPNNGYSIILTDPGHTIVCGGCGTQITDIDPPIPPKKTEATESPTK